MKSPEIWPSSLHLFYVCKCERAALKEQIQKHFDNLITDSAAWSPSSVLLTLHHLLIHVVSLCVTGNNVMNHIVLCVTGPDEFGYWSGGLLIDSSSSWSHFNPTQPEQTGGGSPAHLSACISGCCSHRSMFAGQTSQPITTIPDHFIV